MPIPTEPIGSIPRPPQLLAAASDLSAGRISLEQFQSAQDSALRDSISLFEQTGSLQQKNTSFRTQSCSAAPSGRHLGPPSLGSESV